jgi:nucleoside-diphosphate kinase
MAGATRASQAVPGTIRGDYSLSAQENVVHTSDSLENAQIELDRFFVESDYFNYTSPLDPFKYAPDEM